MDVISCNQQQTGAGTVARAIPLVLLLLVSLRASAQNLSINRENITRTLKSGEQATETFTIENTGDETVHLTLSPRHDPGGSGGKTPSIQAPASTERAPSKRAYQEQSLQETTETRDTTTVIVTLHRPNRSAGKTLEAAEMQIIQRRKERFLEDLPQGDVRVSRMMDGFPTISLRVTAAGLEALQAHPFVKHVSRDRPARPSLLESTQIIGAAQVWNQGYTGKGQTIVILDTGFDTEHPFIANRIVEEACFSGGTGTSVCLDGQRTIKGPGTAASVGDGHGTHITGIVAGDGSYASDIPSGVAPEANIVAIQVFSETSDGLKASREDYISALQYVYSDLRHRYDIAAVNMSMGTEQWHSTTHCANHGAAPIIQQLWKADIATVIASGNEYEKNAVSSPGCIPGAITVGATDGQKVTGFSNNSYLVDLIAPGLNISSSVPSGFSEQYGTSHAAAHVSGAFAALASKQPNASIRTIYDMLVATGSRFGDTNDITKPQIALDRAVEYTPWFTIDHAQDHAQHHRSLDPGETWTVSINFDGSTLPASGAEDGYRGAVEVSATDSGAPMQIVSMAITEEKSERVSSTSTLNKGWNLVGIAVEPDNPSIEAVFPSASPNASYLWDGGYVRAESAVAGEGYWIYSSENNTSTIVGKRITKVAWQLDKGWNLVSGPDCPDTDLTRSQLEEFGNIITHNTMKEWDNEQRRYTRTDLLDPHKGYWVHAFQSGTVTIDCSKNTPIQGGKRITSAHPDVDPGDPPSSPVRTTGRSSADLPGQFALHGNYPNPFNPSTTIRFDLPEQSEVTVTVVDVLGRTVQTIKAGSMQAGSRTIRIDAGNLPGGTYLYRVTARMNQQSRTATASMTLVK